MSRRLVRPMMVCLATLVLSLAACNSTPPTAVVQLDPTEAPSATATSSPTRLPATPTPSPTVTAAQATATPTRRPASPTPAPGPTEQTYTIQETDTLLGVAVAFDTTTETLAKLNGIDEDDLLQVGQVLVIPTPTPTRRPTATPTRQSTRSTPQAETVTVTAVAAVTQALAPTDTPAPPPPPPPTPTPSGPPLPTVTHGENINPLTGLAVADPSVLQRRPLMVRVGNDVGTRPQVGLNSADMVYEEITEWWVTRFTAIFLTNAPDTVGPIRSARLINVQLVPQYQGALAHSGGSDPVRWEISQAPIVNLDEFYSPAPYFYRPNEGWQTRLALNAQGAREYMASKGLEAPVKLEGFLFSDTIDRGEPGQNIYIPYPRSTSFTEWHYDAASGKYLRTTIGSPLYDFNGGQIAASNVIIYFAEHQDTDIIEDTNGATSIRIMVNGRGPAWFFRDGKLNPGFWQTDGSRTPFFGYEDAQPYPLKPGNTWVEVVPVSYKIGLNSADEASSK